MDINDIQIGDTVDFTLWGSSGTYRDVEVLLVGEEWEGGEFLLVHAYQADNDGFKIHFRDDVWKQMPELDRNHKVKWIGVGLIIDVHYVDNTVLGLISRTLLRECV